MDNFTKYFSEMTGVPTEELKKIDNLYTVKKVKKVKKGEVLLREGDLCEGFFFVEKGLLRMYSIDKNGKEHIIQFAPENWIVSDRSSQFFNEKSNYYIDAIENSEILILENGIISKLAKRFSIVVRNNEVLLQKHIRNLQSRINSLMSDTAEQRYLKFVKKYPDILLRVPQWMVASYLGITPESLSRVRKELARKNFQID